MWPRSGLPLCLRPEGTPPISMRSRMSKLKYHVHIDAVEISEEALAFAVEKFGFVNTNFAHVPTGVEHYEPAIHFTLKTNDPRLVRNSIKILRERFCDSDEFIGYLEAEYIAHDKDLLDQPTFRSQVPKPFIANKKRLLPGEFRESEIHVTMLTEDFGSPVAEALREMGMFTALMEKPFGTAQIFTLQGEIDTIRAIFKHTHDYLLRCGGYTNCSIKEERIIDYWLSAACVSLPPVIERVCPFSNNHAFI